MKTSSILGRPSFVLAGILLLAVTRSNAELRFGAATADITPDQPVALDGQRSVRISRQHATPISATALALESRDGDRVLDQAILVSCDLVAIREGIVELVRDAVRPRLPDFDPNKLFLSATHTHTAPVTQEGRYALPDEGVMTPTAYVEFMVGRIADAVVQSWQSRRTGKVGWGQGQAVVAKNRRSVFADGSAVMYGRKYTDAFRGLEGYEDHDLDVLFFWDADGKLVATAINVPCPAQEVEGLSTLHADFWHPVRESLRAKHGKDLHVLGWTGAAGDQSPHLMVGQAADDRMRKLRGLTRLEEIARRIVNGWTEAHEVAVKDMRADAVLRHHVEVIQLPYRKVTDAELKDAEAQAEKFRHDPKQRWNFLWHQSVVTRHQVQQTQGVGALDMELHVLRLGDVAIASNDFELFTDYGIQMKARSPAVQTFIIQLAGSAGYLPSVRAVHGGGYSAVIQSSRIGPDGGQVLVEKTVAAMQRLWAGE
jgi:hypothetical protein